jgi:mannose-6-phosphate isomerase
MVNAPMRRLSNPVRHYAWGSPTVIPEFVGTAPDGRPYAELWLGAHPRNPSTADVGGETVSLDELIARDPGSWLGDQTGRSATRLPFLLKVLAADEPLSLQVHPNRDQALAGHADEESRGVGRDAPERAFPDDNHKPELLCALTPFRLVVGFRPPAESAGLIDLLDIDALTADAATLRDPDCAAAVRRVLERWLRLETDAAARLTAEVGAAAAAAVGTPAGPYDRELRNVADLAARHADIGPVVTLLMHHVELAPGEAVFAAAGALHTYLSGVGLEILACSDNVVRAGLTAKHVDVDLLLELVDTTPGPPPLVRSRRTSDGEEVYDSPAEDFRLSRLAIDGARAVTLPAGRPQILLVAEGAITVSSSDGALPLTRGGSVVVAAKDPPVRLTGDGIVVRATTADAPLAVGER